MSRYIKDVRESYATKKRYVSHICQELVLVEGLPSKRKIKQGSLFDLYQGPHVYNVVLVPSQ